MSLHSLERKFHRLAGLLATNHYLGTAEPMGDDPARNYSERRTRCYELACYALLFGDAPEGSLLIHGTIDGGEGTLGEIGHAWLRLSDGTIWEPINGDLFRDNKSWREWAHPRVHKHYTKDEARRLVTASGHWGPWPPNKEN